MTAPHDLLDQFLAAYNDHDLEAMAALYSDTAILVEPGREVIRGRTSIREHWAEMFEAFPDVKTTYAELLTSDLAGMAEGTIQGTHTGAYPTPSGVRLQATGRGVMVPFVTSITVSASEIVSQRVYLDSAEIARQLRPG
jgi:uncharacterized protein (TIGR02246 family)